MKVNDAVPVLPAASVSLATMVCAPCARPLGVNDQAPLAFGRRGAEHRGAFGQRHHRVGVARAAQRRVRGDLVARR